MPSLEDTSHTPVLIVGGGLVGLSAALFLRYHGVDCVLVERREHPSELPRSRGVHVRTVELFRQIGIEEHVQHVARSALKAGAFGGARMGKTLMDSTDLPMDGVRRGIGADPSPSSFCFCPQVLLEPVLADLARERGADVHFGAELLELRQDADHVTATVNGHTITADYLIAADGAGSPIRETLGIAGWSLPSLHHYVNAYARVDLAETVQGRTFSQCEIVNDDVRALILAKNNTDEWSFHLEYDPRAETLRDYPPDRCADLVRAAVGRSDLDVEILAASTWDDGVHVADEYRRGRVLLAGDAAHRHAPWGGFGANTGIADAHNLAWKLAAVLAGHADSPLLDTYQTERRPRAVLAAEQARARTDFLARYGIATHQNRDDVARHIDSGAIMTRYRYASSAVCPGADTQEQGWVNELTAQSGTRLPHMWLKSGDAEVSTLDLCGPGFAIVTTATTDDWDRAAQSAAARTGLTVSVHRIGQAANLVPVEGDWAEATESPADGALLVRPDGHVAARTDEGLRPDDLDRVLLTLVGRLPSPPDAG
ncbi:monooxygenase FAD-binding [Catenulispora acidiphila DSM 44928]|uniref:Monooxygenase FAD-binding n=1 Tax=Catenulispora acidiphila (strain DSM 44928 / JCM 14897 / NBRC 102108 / NRRL B-24433 / ID139908) TaxID=479433 RepID=C7QEL2_CATAD|nr:FAD-dependent monooxygenase [Catenulispora acidiphila]ACU72782.1 monooxygenase FAD-binding [Catenulispora acidiphila DSM 44928]